MESYRNAAFLFDQINPSSFLGGDHRWPVAGLWLALEQKINLSQNCGAMLGGWWLVPSNRRGAESEESLRTFFELVDTGDEIFIAVPRQTTELGFRNWDTQNDWWYVDAAITWGPSRTFTVLGGFRYEHFSTTFQNPRDAVGVPATPGDRADVTINSYFPYCGLQYILAGSTSSFNVRVLGVPYVPAGVTHFETGESGTATRVESKGRFTRSYFLELFTEYSLSFYGNASAGAFFRWNVLHGLANLHTEVQPGHVASSEDRISFDRNTVTVGGFLSLSFTSPF